MAGKKKDVMDVFNELLLRSWKISYCHSNLVSPFLSEEKQQNLFLLSTECVIVLKDGKKIKSIASFTCSDVTAVRILILQCKTLSKRPLYEISKCNNFNL